MEDAATRDWRSYELVRTGGFIRERISITLVDCGPEAPGRFPLVDIPLVCDRGLPRWFLAISLLLVVVLAASFAAMMLGSKDHWVSVAGMWGFGISIPAIVLLGAAMAIAPVRVYRIGEPIDIRRAEAPIVTIRQRAIGHRKYVVKDDAGLKLARIRRTPSAGHLRIDRFGDDEFDPITIRVRVTRRLTGEKAIASMVDIGAGISNLIHPPWKTAAFLARHKHDPRPRDEAWPLAFARRDSDPRWMLLTVNPSAAEGAPADALPSDMVVLATACLFLSLEGGR